MAKTDVININVLADQLATISVPAYIERYENSINSNIGNIVLNSGRPRAHRLRYSVHGNILSALRNEYPVTTGVPIITFDNNLLPTMPNEIATIPFNIQMPDLSGSENSLFWIRWVFDSTIHSSRNQSVTGLTGVVVIQSIPATVDIADSFTHHENEDIVIPFRGNQGSPPGTFVEHSWHPSIADARANANSIDDMRPLESIGYRRTDSPNLYDIDGTIGMRTPAVTSEQMFYGRVQILQEGSVADSDTYTLIIRNSIVPSLSVGNHKGIEGTTIIIPVNYMGGQPAPDRWELDWAPTQQRALNGNFLDANDPRRPANIVYHQHATPRQGANPRTMNMRVTLPYVSRNETIWGRLTIVATDPVTNQPHYTHETFRLVIQDRVEAGIEFPDMATITEMTADFEIQGYAWVGVPPATSMDATVHPNTGDATRDANPLTGPGEPSVRLSRTTLDITDDPRQHQPVTLYFTAPDVQMDEDYGVRVDIVQVDITDDP